MFITPLPIFFGGAAPVFNPLTDGASSALLLWYDFSDGSTVLDSGGNPVTPDPEKPDGTDVYKVLDKSTSGADLENYDSTVSLPSYDPGDAEFQANGLDGLICSTDTLYNNGTTLTDTYKWTLLFCLRLEHVNDDERLRYVMSCGTSSSAGDSKARKPITEYYVDWMPYSNIQAVNQAANSTVDTYQNPFTESPDTDTHVFAWKANFAGEPGVTSTVWYDDGETPVGTISEDYTLASALYNRFVIGSCPIDNPSKGSNYTVFEVLFYDGLIADADRELAFDYFKTKYGV